MKSKTGQPVRGADFFDRDAELAEVWHMVDRDHVLMLAPRRVGKTSMLLHMRDEPREGWQVSFLDVESVDSESRFVARLLAAVYRLNPDGAWWSKLGDRFASFAERIGGVGVGPVEVELGREIGDDWQRVGDTVLRMLGKLGRPTLLAIDEFPIFVRRLVAQPGGEERTRLLLDWFRSVRIDPEIAASRVHFLLAGSVGLDAVVTRFGMSGTINDLRIFRLGELSREQAGDLLARLAEGESFPLPSEVRERILDLVTWRIPYHLQLVFDQLLRWVRFHDRELSAALVDEAFEELLSSESRKHFSHWEERLKDPLLPPQERDLMTALLAAAAKDETGIGEATIRQLRSEHAAEVDEQVLLIELERDGYLTRDGERWRFASSLLRHWWLRWKVSEP